MGRSQRITGVLLVTAMGAGVVIMQ